MKPFGRIVVINLIVLLAYSVAIRIAAGHAPEKSLAIVIVSAYVIGFHLAFCVLMTIAMFATRDKVLGYAWAGATGVLLLVGFSVCLGNAAI